MEPLGEVHPFGLGRTVEHITSIGRDLTKGQAKAIGRELRTNIDIFASIAAGMPRIHPSIMSHKLSLFREAHLVAQKKRRLRAKKRQAVDDEVKIC